VSGIQTGNGSLGESWFGATTAAASGTAAGTGLSVAMGGSFDAADFALSLGGTLAGTFANYRVAQNLTRRAQDRELWVRVRGGTAEDRARVQEAIRTVWGTKRGAEILAAGKAEHGRPMLLELNDKGINQTCKTGQPSCGSGSPFGSNPHVNRDWIAIDPTTPTYAEVAPNGRFAAPPWPAGRESQGIPLEANLAHELGHAFVGTDDGLRGQMYNGLPQMENVIVNENPVRLELGYRPRTRYKEP
jgi:hypothetical protein